MKFIGKLFLFISIIFSASYIVGIVSPLEQIKQRELEVEVWRKCKQAIAHLSLFRGSSLYIENFNQLALGATDEMQREAANTLFDLITNARDTDDYRVLMLNVFITYKQQGVGDQFALELQKHDHEEVRSVGKKIYAMTKGLSALKDLAAFMSENKYCERSNDTPELFHKREITLIKVYGDFLTHMSVATLEDFIQALEWYKPKHLLREYIELCLAANYKAKRLFTQEELEEEKRKKEEQEALEIKKRIEAEESFQADIAREHARYLKKGSSPANKKKKGRNRRAETITIAPSENPMQSAMEFIRTKFSSLDESLVELSPLYVRLKDSFGRIHTIYNVPRFKLEEGTLRTWLDEHPEEITYHRRVQNWRTDPQRAVSPYINRFQLSTESQKEQVILKHRFPKLLLSCFRMLGTQKEFEDRFGNKVPNVWHYGWYEEQGERHYVIYMSGFTPGTHRCYHQCMKECSFSQMLTEYELPEEFLDAELAES